MPTQVSVQMKSQQQVLGSFAAIKTYILALHFFRLPPRLRKRVGTSAEWGQGNSETTDKETRLTEGPEDGVELQGRGEAEELSRSSRCRLSTRVSYRQHRRP